MASSLCSRQSLSKSFRGNTNKKHRDFYSLASKFKEASSSYLPRFKHALHRRLLTHFIVLACLLGVFVGILLRLRKEPYTARERMHIRFPGEVMVNMLRLLVLPLMVSSIISGISLEDTNAIGKIGLWTLGYFLFTYIVSAVLGTVLAISIFPTSEDMSKHGKDSELQTTVPDTVLNLVRQLFPRNLIEATFLRSVMVLTERKVPKPWELADNATNLTTMVDYDTKLVARKKTLQGVNTLGVIMLSLAGGIVINRIGDRGLPLKIFFDAVFEITMVLIGLVNWYTPVGVFFLVVEDVVAMDTTQELPQQISFLAATVAALLMHSVFILPFISFVICRRNPYGFIFKIMNVLVTAVGTSSSLATLPFTVQALESGKMRLSSHAVGIVIPIGASVNMDGSAIFYTIAVIFLGKLQGVEFDFMKILSLWFLSISSAIANTGVPQGSLTAVKVLTDSIGLMHPKIENLVPIDWIIDRFVTSTNVLSDIIGCVVVHQLTRPSRFPLDSSEEEDESTFASESTCEAKGIEA